MIEHNCIENLNSDLDYYDFLTCKICGNKIPSDFFRLPKD
jgi:hypothetical protein